MMGLKPKHVTIPRALLALILLQLLVLALAALFSVVADTPDDSRRACHSHGDTKINCPSNGRN